MRVPLLVALAAALAAAPALAGGDEPKGGSKGGAATPSAGKVPEKDWSEHKGDIPFIVGRERGLKEVAFTGMGPILNAAGRDLACDPASLVTILIRWDDMTADEIRMDTITTDNVVCM